jgi:hypothetical protein
MAIPCRHEWKRILLTRRRVQARADSRSIGVDVCGGGMADLGDRNATLQFGEFADHQRLTLATEVEVYFCNPRSPPQRGSNENTNRLLRQYLPRGTDLSLHSQAKLSAIARQLNERPRKTLLCQTPADKFPECVAAIS